MGSSRVWGVGCGVYVQVRKGLLGSLAAHKIPVIDARAVVEGPGVLSLHPTPTSPTDTPQTLHARNIILAPGSVPFVPPGIDVPPQPHPQQQQQQQQQQQEQQHQIMTSDTAVGLPTMPSYVAIIGAGYIGLEFAEVFSSMGAEVVLIEAGDRLLPGVDPDIAEAAKRLLLQRDPERPIKLHTNTLAAAVKRMQQQTPAPLEIHLKDRAAAADKGVLTPDACLVATGRKPATQVISVLLLLQSCCCCCC